MEDNTRCPYASNLKEWKLVLIRYRKLFDRDTSAIWWCGTNRVT